MSFDAMPIRPQRIAVIGGGISGLATAYLMAPHHAVTLFEAAPRLGGHARTVMAGLNGDQPVDTGFIVFNYANYPHLTRMFQELGRTGCEKRHEFWCFDKQWKNRIWSARLAGSDGPKAQFDAAWLPAHVA